MLNSFICTLKSKMDCRYGISHSFLHSNDIVTDYGAIEISCTMIFIAKTPEMSHWSEFPASSYFSVSSPISTICYSTALLIMRLLNNKGVSVGVSVLLTPSLNTDTNKNLVNREHDEYSVSLLRIAPRRLKCWKARRIVNENAN